MKNMMLGTLVLIPLIAFGSDNSGVKETNYQVGLTYYENKDDNIENWNNTLLFASISVPIYKYIGSSVGVSGYKSGKIRYDNVTSETNSYNVSGSLFLRDKDIGSIGVNVGYGKSKSKIDYDSSSNDYHIHVKSNTYSIYGNYYFDDFTISASRFVSDIDNGNKINTWTIGADYYISDNSILSVSKVGMDSDNKFYVGISHQPNFLNNSTEVGIYYEKNKYNSSASFFVAYYFGTRVSLKVRNREY